MTLIKLPLWWGYVALDEKIHVKRYKGDRAIRNAQDSGTTVGIFDPFPARNIEEATHMILEKWREERVFIKKEAN
jgi:hypothetical protein